MVGARARNPQLCEVTVAFCFIRDAMNLATSAVCVGPKKIECTQAVGLVMVGLHLSLLCEHVLQRDLGTGDVCVDL